MTWPPLDSRPAGHWDDDEGLLRDLGSALHHYPPAPPEFVAAARAALTWRTIDAELAELVYDSATDSALLARTRSGPVAQTAWTAARTLVFADGNVRIEIELSDAGIAGQVSPADAMRVSAETVAGVWAEAAADEIGCFLLPVPPSDPFRLHARGPRYISVTRWVWMRQ